MDIKELNGMLADIEAERAELLEQEYEELTVRHKSLVGKCYGYVTGQTTYCIKICDFDTESGNLHAVVVYSGEDNGIYECQCCIDKDDTGLSCISAPTYSKTDCFDKPLAIVGDNYFFNVLVLILRGGYLCHV